jgi:hypothetical protein
VEGGSKETSLQANLALTIVGEQHPSDYYGSRNEEANQITCFSYE